ncbi:DUF4235 domain-containing protein [Gleimia hominis]|uniref:DUF4235 domain-containing protein n=1 Tax=Gleimia hominis TaxID=595468 RepID=A0ABU3I9E1_9ACTO|nr:DUF4235 domain-containing protein [Gleimia hominis]MDT3766991.1 DUF4235 domain-containing protein [Gleimia hominis]WIK64442.1 DUF4235 domain-containing protein [Gleimia hominis]
MNVPYKLATAGALAAAGFAANQIVNQGWKVFTGHESPQNEDEDQVELVELLVFAAISGVLATMARRYVLRGTKKAFAKSI